MKLIDCHCHLHEYGIDKVREFSSTLELILAVSDDYESSKRTVDLSREFRNIIPGIGIHPWEAHNDDASWIEDFISTLNTPFFFGEIGLDLLFTPKTIGVQRRLFEYFIDLAAKHNIPVNLHAAGAWREVYEIVSSRNLENVLFHWYTGPTDLLKEIVRKGWFVSFNPAISIQEKQRKIAELTPLENILIESDGPYKYKGIIMGPDTVQQAYEIVAKIKGIDLEELCEIVKENVQRFLRIKL